MWNGVSATLKKNTRQPGRSLVRCKWTKITNLRLEPAVVVHCTHNHFNTSLSWMKTSKDAFWQFTFIYPHFGGQVGNCQKASNCKKTWICSYYAGLSICHQITWLAAIISQLQPKYTFGAGVYITEKGKNLPVDSSVLDLSKSVWIMWLAVIVSEIYVNHQCYCLTFWG